MGCGTRLCSDFFEVCGQLFRLEVYPGGFTADACRYVSVFLTTPGSLNPNHIMYEIAILDQVGPFRQKAEHLHAHILVSFRMVTIFKCLLQHHHSFSPSPPPPYRHSLLFTER